MIDPPNVFIGNGAGYAEDTCRFVGVKWDKEALIAVNNVSKALLNLTELFKSQNIKITMIRTNDEKPIEEESKDKS